MTTTPARKKPGPKKGTKKRNPSRKPFERIKGLGHERLAAVEQMLIKGDACLKVAAIIQDDWGLFQDIQQLTLSRQLQRYKDKELATRLAVYSETLDDGRRKIILADLEEKFDVMLELQQLCMAQKGRVSKMLVREQSLPTLITSLSADIRLYKDTLSELARLQMETGLLRRVSRKFDMTAHLRDTDGAKYVEDSRTVNQQLAMATQQALMELGLGDVIDGEVAND